MDFYLTDIETNNRIHFPVNPTQVPLPRKAQMVEYNFMDKGTRKFPNGTEAEQISLEGFFPKESLRNMSYVKSWRSPEELVKDLENYWASGKMLKLLVTETPVNMDVFITEFTPVWGQIDRVPYTLLFTRAEECIIKTVGEQNMSSGSASNTARPEPPTPSTYTVKSGDTLWAIAQKYLGNGNRYTEIHIENKPPLSSNPSLIYPGQVLKMPV